MVQVFVRTLRGLAAYDVEDVAALQARIEASEGIPASAQVLRRVGGGAAAVEADATFDLSVAVVGGVIEPTLERLAKKYNCDKQICRKCYARLPPRAANCRKKKCGHTNQLRPKKKLK
mmetsp:Transcript_23380/g.81470  ORF Transcript_23380/g.81470 Transcript_23380/m.81470 type:complete len:118 (-) Transcript_23380:579-932(-)